MDDNQQKQNQKPVQENTIVDFSGSGTSSSASQNSGQTIKNPQQAGQQSTMQTPFTASHPKELEPMPSLSSSQEWLQPVEEKVELEPEVEEAGVEAVSPSPKISEQEKDFGLKLAKETIPMEKEQNLSHKYPMTKAQAKQTAKGFLVMKDTSNPMLWLALLILRQMQMQEKQEKSEGIKNAA